MAVLGRRLLTLTAAMVVAASGVSPAEGTGLVTILWVPFFDLCTSVPGAMCLQTADGATLQVTDLSVTEGGTDCIDLPKTHGDYVRVFDNLAPEALEPDLTALMRTGSCADGSVDELDTVFVDSDTHLTDSIDASVSAGRSGFSGDATFDDFGLGACGRTNKNTDLVFSLPASMFDPSTPGGNPNLNKMCGRKARVARGSKSVVVTLVDRCPTCKRGDVDLSPTAFKKLDSVNEGRVKVTWKFIS